MATFHGKNKKIMQLETMRNGFNYIELWDNRDDVIGQPAFANMVVNDATLKLLLATTVEIAVPANVTISKIALKDKNGTTILDETVNDVIGASPTIYSISVLEVLLWFSIYLQIKWWSLIS